MSNKILKLVSSCLLCLASVSTASATVFSYEFVNGAGPGNPAYSNGGGDLDYFGLFFDTATGNLTAEWTVSANNNGALSNGFTLVLTDGDNPKGIAMNDPSRSFAMLYFDATNANPVLTAYKYDNTTTYTSYQDPNPMAIGLGDQASITSISSTANADGSMSFGYTVNQAALGGLEHFFGAEVGIWFHLFDQASFSYGDSGRIAAFGAKGGRGFLDGDNLKSTEVPEPSTMALLASGVIGMRLRGRKAAKAAK